MHFGLQYIAGLPLANIIIASMRAVVNSTLTTKAFVHPLLLTKVFKAFNVPLTPEEQARPGPLDVLDESAMRRLHYVRVHDGWQYVEGMGPRRAHDDAAMEEEAELDVRDAGYAPPEAQEPASTSGYPTDPTGELDQIRSRLHRVEGQQDYLIAMVERMGLHMGLDFSDLPRPPTSPP